MKTEKYTDQLKRLPQTGQQLIGCREDDAIIVYQAFNKEIAAYATANQRFGGTAYSFTRMSWIKPGFLWMMYRAGWASKEQQEHILRIKLPLTHFKTILKEAAFSSFNAAVYESADEWKAALEKTAVRLQWDPDHDPFGNKQQRKAIQLGMKGAILKQFCTEWITEIRDITAFVKERYAELSENNIEQLYIPYEEVIDLNDAAIEKRIGIRLN
jgi:Domain of unknown function (DUF4291)